MSEWPRKIGAITLFVEDHARSKAFYERAFQSDVVFEDDDAATIKLENTLLNLLSARAAPELVEPAAVGTRDAGARSQLTIFVDDVDTVCGELRSRGVEFLNGPLDRPWGVRTAAFSDPDGHIWEIAASR